jgi:putative copper export protein
MAVLSVAVLVATDAVETLLHLRAVSDFFATAYGLALFIKFLAVSLLLLLGLTIYLR